MFTTLMVLGQNNMDVYVINNDVDGKEVLREEVEKLQNSIILELDDNDNLVTLKSKLEELSTDGSHISSVNILSHGNEGAFSVGNQTVSNETFESTSNMNDIYGLNMVLDGNCYFNVYSCLTGRGEEGQKLMNNLASILYTKIALSDDKTGINGDWILEVKNFEESITGELSRSSMGKKYQFDLQTPMLPGYTVSILTAFPSVATEMTMDWTNGVLYSADASGATTGLSQVQLNPIALSVVPGTWQSYGFHPYWLTDIEYYNNSIYSYAANLSERDLALPNAVALPDVSPGGSESGMARIGDVLYYVAGGNLWSYDLLSNLNVAIMPVPGGSDQTGLDYCQATNKLYLAANVTSTIYEVDLTGLTFIPVAIFNAAGDGNFTVDPTGQFAFMSFSGNVKRYDLSLGTEIDFVTAIPGGLNYADVTFGPSSGGVSGYSLYIGASGNIYEVRGFCTPTTISPDLVSLPDATGSTCSVTPSTPTATDDCGITVNGVPDVTFPITTSGTTVVTWTYTSGAVSTTQTQNVIVDAPALQTVSPLTQEICYNTAATIDVLGTELGIDYYLRDDADNSVVDGPIAGTGGPIAFTTGNLTATTNYNVLASGGVGCETEMTPIVTVVIDATAPNAICQDITVQLDALGVASIVASDIDNGSTDFCAVNLAADITSFNCGDVGNVTVTLTVTDDVLPVPNSSTCISTVTVEDNVAPTALCNPFSINLDNAGLASIVPGDVDGGSSDACGIASLVVAPNSFTCSETGDNNVILTVTDNNGNVATCNTTVTVQDVDAPNMACQNIVVSLDATGSATITTGDVDNGSSDNCSFSLSLDDTFFTCAAVGINVVTLTGTDASGNSAFCNASVTIQDVMNPNALCQDITVQLDATGNASIVGGDVDNGSNDNCGIASLSVFPNSFDCTNVGINNVVLTVTDVNSNTATCNTDVTVVDNVAPVAICQDVIVNLDAAGSGSTTAVAVDNGSNDACGIASLGLDNTNFNCGNVGSNTVTLTVTDNNGNTSTCTATVDVQDNIAPTAICQDITVALDLVGAATIVPGDINNGSNDACGIVSTSLDITNFSCADVTVSPVTVTLTVTDNNGNSSTCTGDVTVVDTQSPIVTCPGNIVLNIVPDNCGRIVNYAFSAVDNCSFTITQTDGSGYTDGSLYPVGITNQSYNIVDEFGNTTVCAFTVEIIDNQNPTITGCPGPVLTVNTDPGVCEAIVSWIQPTASDNCPGIVFSTSNAPGATYPLGLTTVTYTATDDSGNTATCVFDVDVQDNENPIFVDCPSDVFVSNDPGLCQAAVALTAPTVDDNCSVASVTPSSAGPFPVGTTVVTWTVIDGSGNSNATCTQNINVTDNEAPIASCQDITIQLNAGGSVTILDTDIEGGASSDNCGIGGYSASQTAFNCTNVGNNTVTLTVTDIYGNTGTCSSTVTVEDNIAPVALCQNITVQLDAAGNGTANAADVDNGSNDACGIASLSLAPNAFTCANVGGNAVTLTVTDVNGNTATCNAVVTVEDNVAPNAVCQDITIQLDASGAASIVAADVDGGSNDACGVLGTSVDITNFSCANLGNNTVTLMVNDNNGNSSNCTATVTVEDVTAPVAVCQDITVQLDVSGNATIAGPSLDGGSTDACGGLTFTASPDAFTCANLGANSVVLTVTDASGNSSTCNSTVTVEDVIAPIVICPSITSNYDLILNFGGFGDETYWSLQDAMFITVASGGPFGGFGTYVNSFTLNAGEPFTFNISTTGFWNDNNVSYTLLCNGNPVVVGGIGGGSSASVPGIVLCGGAGTTVSTDPGLCSFTQTTNAWDATGADNCTVTQADYTLSGATGGSGNTLSGVTFNEGVTTVTWTVTDQSGNVSSSCSFDVTVNDNEAPNAICQDVTVALDAAGSATILDTDIDGGSTDNCGVAGVSASQTVFACAEIGVVPVTLTVTDVNGNTATCIANVTVEDNIVPTIACPGDIAVNNDLGVCEAMVTFADPIYNDNCGGAAASLVQNTAFIINDGIACTSGTDITNHARYYDLIAEGVTGDFDISSVDFGVLGVNNAGGDLVTLNFYVVPSFPLPAASMPAPLYSENVIVPMAAAGTMYNHTLASVVTIPAGSIFVFEVSVNAAIGTYSHLLGYNDSFGASANDTQSSYINGTCGVPDYTTMASIGFNSFAALLTVNGLGGAQLTQTAGLPSGSSYPVGTTTNTFMVSDASGNTASCSFTVTVDDVEAPVAVCNNITVQLDATGNASISAVDIDGGATADNCGMASTSLDITSFNCLNVGANTVTLTATDIYANVSTCTSTVTVEDNVAPTAICQDITVQLDATGNASIVEADIDNGSNDACGILSLALDTYAFDCSDVGTNTVTLTVTDVNGNTDVCTSTVTVENNNLPVALCQDITVQLDAAGNTTITGADIDNGSNAACGIASLVASPNSFDCSNVGANIVTLTVTDNTGNTATCTSTVTVEDNVAPNALCLNIVVQLDATGAVTIVPADVDGGSNDACGIATTSIDIANFNCANIGANNVTLTVVDVNGNSSSCIATVTVEDNVSPVITCPSNLTVSADPGICEAWFVAYGTATATDACGIASITDNAPTPFALGNTTVTWTAVDVNGNSATCNQIVTVVDSENPVIACPANVIVSNDPGSCFATGVVIGMAGATDNCTPPLTVTITENGLSNYPVGVTNVTWTATDDAGNTISCTQTVTVNDTEAPAVTCPSNVIVDTDPSNCFATGVALGTPMATDNCTGIASVTNDGPLAYMLGTTVVTWTVTDNVGNSKSCTQSVTVEDNENPVIICPANINTAADPGACDATLASIGTELTFDNCTVALVSNDAPVSGVYSLGTTTVTWTVEDAAGNTTSCTQTINVIDTQNPTIACPPAVIVSNDPGSCDASGVALGAPLANDNCSVASVSNNALATFPLGTTTVTWTVVDGSGNTGTCTQSVTVNDTEAPAIACPSDVIVATAGGSCDVSFVALGSPVTADNCSVASVTNDELVTYPLGTTIVTWTVTDGAGNTATCTQQVTVVDTENPLINCPSDVVVSADPGVCDATGVVIGMATATDNCTVASITDNGLATYPLGTTTVTWTTMDAAGNTASCTQTVTVIDTELPTITCPGDMIVSADPGVCDAAVAIGLPFVNDNCSIASITNDDLGTYPLGTTTVTWVVVDGSGNTVSCTQNITVEDYELPTIVCAADVVVGTIPGTCEGTTVLIAPATGDNCSVASVTNDAPALYALGTTAVTWTIVDGSGNTSICMQTVTVNDTEAPTITCPSDLTQDTDPGICEATVAIGSPIVNDNCNINSVWNDDQVMYPLGTSLVTWTVMDDYGNSTSCTQTITVEDNEAPLVSCPADLVLSNVPGNCGRNVSYTVPSFADNCQVTAMTQTDGTGLSSGAWFPIGTSTQEFTVVDEAGNTYTCAFNITINDVEAPQIVVCPSDMSVYSTADKCDMTVLYGNPVITDNCPGVSYTASNVSGDAFPVGITNVNITAMDDFGNTSVCTFTVEVIDTIHPVVPVLPSVEGGCSVTLATPVASDNCAGSISGVTATTFPITATGITAVVWTFDDGNGNISTTTQYVDIDGTIDATVSLVNEITLESNNTTPGVTYQWFDCNTGFPLAGETNQQFNAVINGSYAVEVTEPGCGPQMSICYDITTVGIGSDIALEDLTVYPNPSNDGIFKIEYNGTIDQIEVIDMIGRYVTVPTSADKHIVNASELATGKYMLRIYTEAGVVAKEVIIIK